MRAARRWRSNICGPTTTKTLGATGDRDRPSNQRRRAASLTDLPPGPDAEASMASPAVTEQKAVVEPTDLPKAVPTERR